ncbi:MAG: ATP-binding protein [Candidatus Kapabacteria bacterium]|nr:ATP-binding protein [Candidatus Kapabacteria bacterium]
MEKELKVNQISLYREIAKNLVNPLEVIREAISNSHDAKSSEIMIKIFRNSDNIFCIEISDDGNGMGVEEFERFFNLGDSQKLKNNIGQKGLGTKTYFRSHELLVESQNKDSKKRYKATLNEPWDKLNQNVLPKYEFDEIEYQPGKDGTIISIQDYRIDHPERYFNIDTLQDYILWYTAAGSFKTKFADKIQLQKYVQNIHISPKIFLRDELNKKDIEFAGSHQFAEPNENPIYDFNNDQNPRSDNYCRHFGPFYRETTIEQEFVSFQLYGTVSGKSKRREISHFHQGETQKSRFGLYLCKDFIPVVNRRDLLKDSNYQHYHLLLNSQNFDLTADRNNISNEDDPKIKWILNEFDILWRTQIKSVAEESYIKLRVEEIAQADQKKRIVSLKNRISNYSSLPSISGLDIPVLKIPNNEAQVAILFTALLTKYPEKFDGLKIGHHSDKSTTDLICEKDDNSSLLVELEYVLSNLFRHGHAFETFDYVVCWNVDLEINQAKRTPEGNTLKLIKTDNKWFLKYGPSKLIPIIELRQIVEELRNSNN